jgi:ParG
MLGEGLGEKLYCIIAGSAVSVRTMHISIADNNKKRFHTAFAMHGLKISHVITELVEQWLKEARRFSIQ